MLALLRRMPGNARFYVAIQKSMDEDGIRYHSHDKAKLKPGNRVFDGGYAQAYSSDRLPPVDYVGFETSDANVAYARQQYGNQGDSQREALTAGHLGQLGRFDAILLLGLLHHLDDARCTALLVPATRMLAPGRRVVSCDTTTHGGRGLTSRWISEKYRGDYVRRPVEPTWN